MSREDIDFAVSLIDQEGWGYTHVDFERMLMLDPEGSFIYEDGRPLGIVTCVSYGTTGVVGHLLVSRNGRSKRVGESLLNAALGYLEGAGVDSILLYSTVGGARFYERFGFRKYRSALCMSVHGEAVPRPPPVLSCSLLMPEDLAEVISVDKELFGDDRTRILEMLYSEFPGYCFKLVRDDRIVSFVFGRKTPVGFDLGPWVSLSDDKADAEAPLRAFFRIVAPGKCFLGVFPENAMALSISQELKKSEMWNTFLMTRGSVRYAKDISKVFGLAAFELG